MSERWIGLTTTRRAEVRCAVQLSSREKREESRQKSRQKKSASGDLARSCISRLSVTAKSPGECSSSLPGRYPELEH